MTPENINLNNLNFSNLVNSSQNNNNINNHQTLVNNLFQFFINPLKEIIANLKDEIKRLKSEIEVKEQDKKYVEKKIEELDKKCSVCFTDKLNIIFIPCGHLCMCNKCNDKFTQHNILFCPICRSNGTRYEVYS